jgi:predicted nucleic acid-binding protein
LRRVVVDTNVFASVLTDRDARQNATAKALLLSAERGEIVAVLPQFVIFEIAHVLRNFYKIAPGELASLIHDTIELPGVIVIDHCPWTLVLEHWPEPFSSVADAAIVAVAMANRFDAVATFDQKLITRMKSLGVASYW